LLWRLLLLPAQLLPGLGTGEGVLQAWASPHDNGNRYSHAHDNRNPHAVKHADAYANTDRHTHADANGHAHVVRHTCVDGTAGAGRRRWMIQRYLFGAPDPGEESQDGRLDAERDLASERR
jgi:hypothetical protein